MFSLAEATISITTDETSIKLGIKETCNISLHMPATVLMVSDTY